jgi:hypothetical protein
VTTQDLGASYSGTEDDDSYDCDHPRQCRKIPPQNEELLPVQGEDWPEVDRVACFKREVKVWRKWKKPRIAERYRMDPRCPNWQLALQMVEEREVERLRIKFVSAQSSFGPAKRR